jgi:molybdate transport system substrate-binding protein
VRRTLIIPVAIASVVLAACSHASAGANGERGLTVFAASSLTAAFKQIGKEFQDANPGTTVTFNFGPSDGLASQIETEGVADVFASASPTWMDEVAAAPGVSDRTDFVRNQLVIITPPDDPAHIASVADLANDGVALVLAAPGVPVGDYARETLSNAGIARPAEANVVSNEEDDASAVAKIASGEADAGVVYASDLTQAVAPTVRSVAIPSDVNVIATYPIAVVNGSADTSLARAFVRYVTQGLGQATLRTFGFLPPRS